MKQTLIALILAGFGTLALAQPSPPEPMPPTQPTPDQATPDRTAPPSDYSQQSSAPSSATSSGSTDKHTLMKQCEAQQKAASTGMSKKDIKEYCKKQVNEATSSQSPHN